jgi:hypothetical protein
LTLEGNQGGGDFWPLILPAMDTPLGTPGIYTKELFEKLHVICMTYTRAVTGQTRWYNKHSLITAVTRSDMAFTVLELEYNCKMHAKMIREKDEEKLKPPPKTPPKKKDGKKKKKEGKSDQEWKDLTGHGKTGSNPTKQQYYDRYELLLEHIGKALETPLGEKFLVSFEKAWRADVKNIKANGSTPDGGDEDDDDDSSPSKRKAPEKKTTNRRGFKRHSITK